MDWQGIRDDLSATDQRGALEANNVSFGTDGELRLRYGLGDKIAESGVLSTEFQHPTLGNYVVFANASGELRSVKLSDNTETTLASSLSTTITGCFARSQGRLYYVNDFDAMRVTERGDTASNTAGITAPAAAIGSPTETAGNVTLGVHLIRYRYYNSKSGYMSNPSDALTHTVSSSTKSLEFTITDAGGGGDIIRSTDTKVDQVIVEMTAAGGSTYYRAARGNQADSSISVNVSDTSLVALDPTENFGDFGHEKPPLTAMLCEHRGRLFGWGASVRSLTGLTVTNGSATVTGTGFSTEWAGRLITFSSATTQYRILSVASSTSMTLSETYALSNGTVTAQVFSPTPDMLYWSRANYPESWKPAEWARRVLQNQSDTPAGMASFYGDLYLFGQRSMRVLTYTSDPATARLDHIPGNLGIWNQRCLVEAEGKLFGWGRAGVFVLSGIMPKYMGDPIADTVADTIDATKYSQFHGIYDPRERTITWFYVADGDTSPKSGICFEIDNGKWSTRSWRQAIRASTLVAQGDASVQALLSDENGYSWYQTEDRFDGLPSSLTSGVCTCASGSTTTVIQVSSPSLPSGDLAGAMLYQPSSGESRLISANTADTITVSSAFTTAPAEATEVYIGSIQWSYRTKHIQPESGDKFRPAYLYLSQVPGSSTGSVEVRTYADFAASPQLYEYDGSSHKPDGVTYFTNYATVDMDGGSGDGWTPVPVPQSWKRSLSVKISGNRPKDELRILEMSLDKAQASETSGE